MAVHVLRLLMRPYGHKRGEYHDHGERQKNALPGRARLQNKEITREDMDLMEPETPDEDLDA